MSKSDLASTIPSNTMLLYRYIKLIFIFHYYFFQINKMVLEDKFDGEPLKFIIRSNDPARRDDLRIVCEAESDEIKKIWTGLISRQLDIQWDFLKQLQNPTKAKP